LYVELSMILPDRKDLPSLQETVDVEAAPIKQIGYTFDDTLTKSILTGLAVIIGMIATMWGLFRNKK